MLTNSRVIQHPTNIRFKTPLLTPSFSSKGFGVKKNKSEIRDYLEFSKHFIAESTLISAYDIKNKYLLSIKELTFADITFIDSGGYEISEFYDFSEIKKRPQQSLDWNSDLHEEVLMQWSQDFASVIINFDAPDKRYPISTQANKAKKLFNKFPTQLNDFLIKPEKKNQDFVNTSAILSNINLLKDFNILGITEKELGNSTLNRMLNIYKLRTQLDKYELDAPIHIFGCLDPISCVLYFAAGAEIFDGLTWLRYFFHNGYTMYNRNSNILSTDMGIHTKDNEALTKIISNNIYYLEKLKYCLINFHNDHDLDTFKQIFSDEIVYQLDLNIEIFKNHKA